MEFLQSIDAALFYFFNVILANPVTDKVMPFITERDHWFIFYVLIWLYLMLKGGSKGRTAALLIIPLIFIADQTAANIIKPFFHRIRPCHTLENVNLLINCTQSFSMPSNHAVNNFAAATLFSYFYPSMKVILFTGAFIVAMSRIMCGVHYPFDALAGALFGIVCAVIVIFLWKIISSLFVKR